jgi:hypothetical protein
MLVAPRGPWHDRGSKAPRMKRIATVAIYAVGTLAILYLALYAYAMVRHKSLNLAHKW